MEDRESEYEGVQASLSDDFKRSKELFGELLGGSGHMEILHLNVDLDSNLELQCRSLTGVCWTLIVMLHISDLSMEFLVELIQVHSEFSGTD